jgi:hypothetical protein
VQLLRESLRRVRSFSRSKVLVCAGGAALFAAAAVAGVAAFASIGSSGPLPVSRPIDTTPARLPNLFQMPEYHSSVTVPADSAPVDLTPFAKIAPEAAVDAVTARVPGRASPALLENAQGNVVYAVLVTTSSGREVAVTVDAGTGLVLAQQSTDPSARSTNRARAAIPKPRPHGTHAREDERDAGDSGDSGD